jgi:FAD:protein FMN transferase
MALLDTRPDRTTRTSRNTRPIRGRTVRQAPAATHFDLHGTRIRVAVTDPDRLDHATDIARTELAAIDAVAGRLRPDSEIRHLTRLAGRPTRISDRLTELVTAALATAQATGGDVDPTLGNPLIAAGYDRDIDAVAGTTTSGRVPPAPAARWRDVRLDGNEITVPAGVLLDLGATSKAWAADRCADLVADHCRTGVLIAVGDDIATAGPAPGGWDLTVQDGPGQPWSRITLPAGTAMATSSTIRHTWRQGSTVMHPILDPRTGRPAARIWRTASVIAYTCLRANTLTTATVVRGARAPRWLTDLGTAARLVAADGRVTRIGPWPERP